MHQRHGDVCVLDVLVRPALVVLATLLHDCALIGTPPEGGGHGRAKQDAAVHEASRTKSALSGDIIGLELTLSEGEVHVTDVLPSIEGNIRKGDRVLEIASRPVGEVITSPYGQTLH